MDGNFAKGMVVHHATLGIGRAVALPTVVHVFFAGAKLRLSVAKVFLRPDPDAR